MLLFKADEIYWPSENESSTFGLTVVTHKGTEVTNGITRITIATERFAKVLVDPVLSLVLHYLHHCYIVNTVSEFVSNGVHNNEIKIIFILTNDIRNNFLPFEKIIDSEIDTTLDGY